MRKLHNQEGYCHCISFCVCYLIIIVTTWSGAATKRRRYRWTSQTVFRSDELLLLVLNIFHDTIPTNILRSVLVKYASSQIGTPTCIYFARTPDTRNDRLVNGAAIGVEH